MGSDVCRTRNWPCFRKVSQPFWPEEAPCHHGEAKAAGEAIREQGQGREPGSGLFPHTLQLFSAPSGRAPWGHTRHHTESPPALGTGCRDMVDPWAVAHGRPKNLDPARDL